MRPSRNYHEQEHRKNALKLRSLIDSMPSFVFEFFRGLEPTTSSKTRIAYAYDLRIFIDYLKAHHEAFKGLADTDITLDHLNAVTPDDIERYLEYLNYYITQNHLDHSVEHVNTERGKSRKLACIRTLYNYFYKKRKITNNPASIIDMPKIHQKNIIRLEIDEVAKLLDAAESGDLLTDSQKKFHNKTKLRDMAILTLLLGTGVRVSECVGLNLNDIDFNVNGLRIVRKGGSEVIIYFGEEVEAALRTYIADIRSRKAPLPPHEDALFLSLQDKRMGVRSVQNMVKKYAELVITLKNISPHKLRSTYGTSLYRETGDIYLVADVLGHKDVNTTKKHYAQIEDERRRMAAKAVTLRHQD